MAFLYFSPNYDKLFNCTFYDYKNKPYEERSNPNFGWLLIVTFGIVWALYIPCIIVMFKKELIRLPCYKLMVYMAFCDLNTSIYVGFLAGYASISGNVFCAWPKIAFWIGCLNGMAWKMQSTAIILLAFNRCIEAFDNQWGKKLFEGKKIYAWMLLPFLWGFQDIFWGPPGNFNPIYSLIFYNPHMGYFEDYNNVYIDSLLFSNNVFVVISIIIIYGAFSFSIYIKSGDLKSLAKHTNVFGQILLLAISVFLSATGFLIAQFFDPPPWIFPWLQYTFIAIDGQPAMIYLTMNSTMRNEVFKLFKNNIPCKKSRKTNFVTGAPAYVV